ncbi:hypothetical protein PENANT_c019G08335 [Penicillium antarcticum]|uniref:Uncharacterized protein n=1 Tax=Penicillium antarcticum TaxID=416450 RepID=A0A1V6Q163_9EURO|nr:uncharacterized protein N7508_001188 [Penicillium antarcticum]KAJ5316680.1 hypothetical protein N7508_001188 [Penicillium antarcticum]OQD82965.1 hypothetical protein PENANT_c019G08335 [Penicillium antarcticum]
MPKRTKPRSTDVSLDYLNNVNTELKRRRTVNEPIPNIYDLPTSPPEPQETRRARRDRISEPTTRFRALRNRQIGVDPVSQSATPRSLSNGEQQSSNDNQSAEHIDQSTGSQQIQAEIETIGENEANASNERQFTPPAPIHSSIDDLFAPREGYQPESSGFVSINGPRRVSSGNLRPRPRASDLFPAKSPQITEAQNEGEENSSPASVDSYSNGVHSGSDNGDLHHEKPNGNESESDISEEIVEGQDSDENGVEGEEEETLFSQPVHLFSDDADPEAQDDPESDSAEIHSPIPTQHPAKPSAIEVQIPTQTKDSRKRTQRNQSDATESQSSQNQYSSQIPETPAQPRQRRRDHASRKEDAADRPTTSSRGKEPSNRRGTLGLVEDHEVRLGIFSWLKDSVKESGFKEDWELICRQRRTLKPRADFELEGRFSGTEKLIQRLRDLYKSMTQEPYSAHFLIDHCRLIANSIFNEGQSVIVEEAPNMEEDLGGHLINQFEAHIVPDLIKLLVVAFQTWKTTGERAKPHFRIALDLIWAICYRISSIKDVYDHLGSYVLATSREILKSIKVIKDALDDGRLLERTSRVHRVPTKYKHFEQTEVQSKITCDPWTKAEKLALLEGINGPTDDEDTFVDLKSDMRYGPTLERRTLKDLKAEAQRRRL